jgi:tRNA C32,U32 (ribose-2'-O)-methylase TrmJ
VGERAWSKGTTENISRSGVLFRAERVIQPQAQLEINLVLPEEISGLSTAEVICRGEVVRAMPEQPSMNAALAAKILRYEFPQGARHADSSRRLDSFSFPCSYSGKLAVIHSLESHKAQARHILRPGVKPTPRRPPP